MQDASSIGLAVRLVADQTFPTGITFTMFPEDGDVGPTGNNEIAGNASGVNGHLIVWSTVNGIEVNIPLIPNTVEESLMAQLFQANRGSVNRFPKKDVITLTVTNPVTGVIQTYKNGAIKNGPVKDQYGLDGRIKNKVYGFVFEDVI